MRLTDVSDLAVNERFARMRRRMRRRWAITLGVIAFVVAVCMVPMALRLGHGLMKQQRVGNYEALIETYAQEAGVPAELVRSVILAESGGDPRALSPSGARGLMQITAITERDVLQRNPGWEKGDLYEPRYNLRIGTAYLGYLLERFDGDVTLALCAYHMGPTAVRRVQNARPGIDAQTLLRDHAGPQTRAYVRIVMAGVEGR